MLTSRLGDLFSSVADVLGGVASVHHAPRMAHDPLEVVCPVVCGDQHAVRFPQHRLAELHRVQLEGLVVAQLLRPQRPHVRIVVAHHCPARLQNLDHLQRRRLPQVVHVLLVRHPQHQHLRPLQRPAPPPRASTTLSPPPYRLPLFPPPPPPTHPPEQTEFPALPLHYAAPPRHP